YFARIILLLTTRWPILKWINVPALHAMSAFSTLHLVAVFLTEYYFESLTVWVGEWSCIIVPFWLEYAIGLGGFSAVLVLRLVSFCMVLFPICFTENGRVRNAIRVSILACTHGPLLAICMAVSIGGESE